MSQSGTLDVSGGGGGNIQTLTGNTGGPVPPSANNINVVGDGTSVTVTGNPGTSTLTISLTGGGEAIDSIQPNSGTNPVVPTAAGLVTMVGTGSVTTVGSLNTLTTQLTGLTNHAVQIGAGTATLTQLGPTATIGQVLQSAGAAADPAFSTATYPLTTTVSQLLYSSATNTVTGLATANRAVLTTGATGIPVVTALAIDGQLIIGSTAGVPAAATLTAGSRISITNASNSITITATDQTILPITFITDMSSPYTVLSSDYFISVRSFNNPVTILLPNTTTTGRVIIIKDTDTSGVISIPISTPGGVVLIDGSTTYTMNVPLQSINLIWDGTSYEVF